MVIPQPTIKVLCIDDNPDIVALLEITISREAGMISAGCLTHTDNLAEELGRRRPDVALLDLTMPGRDVLSLIRECRELYPEVRFIIFSGRSEPDVIDAAIDAGAWGYICKDRELTELIEAIRAVASGKVVLTR